MIRGMREKLVSIWLTILPYSELIMIIGVSILMLLTCGCTDFGKYVKDKEQEAYTNGVFDGYKEGLSEGTVTGLKAGLDTCVDSIHISTETAKQSL